MNLLIAALVCSFVLICSCSSEFLFFPTDDFYPRDPDLIDCPESCPPDSDPICTSNGFCIKLFDSSCQVLYFNCKNNEEYKQVHQQYCELPRFKNLQPKACFNETKPLKET